jgi:hypothetical protein
VLVWTHLTPTPWFMDEEAAHQGRYMYELGMPGKENLDGLRRNVYHPKCELGPLLKTIQDVGGAGDKRPMAAAIQWPEPDDPMLHRPQGEPLPGMLPVSSYDLFISLAHVTRDRPVLLIDAENQGRLGPDFLGIPALVFVHPEGMDLEARYPNLRKGQSKAHLLRCDAPDAKEVPVRVTRVRLALE